MAELYSFMKCFGSCLFLRGLWMVISCEVANIHMRTDVKNLVTTARTIQPPEQKETIHKISMLRMEARSGSIHDLAHTLTLNCLADCLTKTSAKADNLITAVRTGRSLDVDIHRILEHLCSTRGLLIYLVQKIYVHKREGSFLPEHPQDFSCTISPRRKNFR